MNLFTRDSPYYHLLKYLIFLLKHPVYGYIACLVFPYNKIGNVRISGVPRGVWGFKPPPPKFRRPSKIVPNSTRLWKLLKIAEFRTPTPQDGRKKGSKILKLLRVGICFTLAMTNKLVVSINSLKVPKIKKTLLYKMKFLLPKYSCLHNPWLRSYRPQIPFLYALCPQQNLLNLPPPEQNSCVRHCLQFGISMFSSYVFSWYLNISYVILSLACLLRVSATLFQLSSSFMTVETDAETHY